MKIYENILITYSILHNELEFIHWDLHPNNCLVNPESRQIKFFDFE